MHAEAAENHIMTEAVAGRLLPLLPPSVALALSAQRASREGLFAALSEIRLRAERCASLTVGGENIPLPVFLSASELSSQLLRLCQGSLYAYREAIAEGYLPLFDGIRLGVAGRAVCEDGRVTGVTDIRSLSFRIPHPVPSAAAEAEAVFRALDGRGLLVYSRPGVGKTTLLRDLGRRLANGRNAKRVVIIDSRGELSGGDYGRFALVDILLGYPKAVGIEQAVRTLSPEVLLLDEIGSREEAEAILAVSGCGVPMVATAHAATREELCARPAVRMLLEAGIFGALFGLARQEGRVVGVREEILLSPRGEVV